MAGVQAGSRPCRWQGDPATSVGFPLFGCSNARRQRHARTGETALHLHALIGGLQYRGDRLSGKPFRQRHRKAEELGVDGAAVTKKEVQKLAVRYGFGPVLDITQVQASPGDSGAAFEVAGYLGKYLAKFENLAEWLPKGKQVVAGSLGAHYWAGPGVTRQSTRRERQERARERREALRTAPASGEAPEEPSGPTWGRGSSSNCPYPGRHRSDGAASQGRPPGAAGGLLNKKKKFITGRSADRLLSPPEVGPWKASLLLVGRDHGNGGRSGRPAKGSSSSFRNNSLPVASYAA